jgi:hypothetical protein
MHASGKECARNEAECAGLYKRSVFCVAARRRSRKCNIGDRRQSRRRALIKKAPANKRALSRIAEKWLPVFG